MIGKLFIVSAPSGTGKTTLVNKLLLSCSELNLKRAITYTTRNPRAQEINGADYYFISKVEFLKKLEEEFFLEWSNDYIAYYGLPKSILNELNQGISYIAILDRKGACSVRSIYKEAILIWIEVTDLIELETRLRSRGTNTIEQINYRLKLARQEIELERSNPVFDYKLLNAELSKTLKDLENLVRLKIGEFK